MDRWSDSDSNDEDENIEPNDVKEKFLWAAAKGNINLMQQIMTEDSNVLTWKDSDGYTALHRASSEGCEKVVEFLISNHVDVNARTNDGWSPLHCACRWNNADVAQLLLQNGAEVNSRSNGNVTPLHVAASEKDTREVLLLLLHEDDVDINIKNDCDETPLDLAQRMSCNASLFTIAASHVKLY